jgi:REP element-mobilizing transposase RayT
MPVYLFTYHTYRSWTPDNPRGFVQEDRGVQPPNEALACYYSQAAKFPSFLSDRATERLLIEICLDACQRRNWELHAAATEPTHIHVLVSWKTNLRWQDVRGKLRNLMSLELSKHFDQKGRPWLSTGASRKRVRDRRHFDHLMQVYLLKHGGLKWFENHGYVE